jgi:hypothetical protein
MSKFLFKKWFKVIIRLLSKFWTEAASRRNWGFYKLQLSNKWGFDILKLKKYREKGQGVIYGLKFEMVKGCASLYFFLRERQKAYPSFSPRSRLVCFKYNNGYPASKLHNISFSEGNFGNAIVLHFNSLPYYYRAMDYLCTGWTNRIMLADPKNVVLTTLPIRV